MGSNPLDRIVAEKTDRPVGTPTGEKKHTTFYVSVEVVERARDAVYALSGPPHRLTLSGVVEEGLRLVVERLEREENRGKRFPERPDSGRASRVR